MEQLFLVGKKIHVSQRYPHGRSIKWPRVYRALRRQGKSKSTAAAISNAHYNKYRRWGKAGNPGAKSMAEHQRRKRLRKQLGLGDVHANIAPSSLPPVAYHEDWEDTYTDEEIETIANEAAMIWHVGADGVAVEKHDAAMSILKRTVGTKPNGGGGQQPYDEFGRFTSGGRISTAPPKGKVKGVNRPHPMHELRRLGTDQAMKDDPEIGEKWMRKLSKVAGFGDLAPKPGRKVHGLVETAIERVKQNILDIHDRAAPKDAKQWGEWYPIANKLGTKWAKETNVHPDAVYAVIARLSPQTDWNDNMTMAREVVRILHEDPVIDKATLKAHRKLQLKQAEIYKKDPDPALPKDFEGKRVSELDASDAARVVRAISDARGPLQVIDHEEKPMNKVDGAPRFVRWQSNDNIMRSVEIYRKPTFENISLMMGEQHKIRAFYNNIREPDDAEFDDVTVDTHAFGIGLGIPVTTASSEIASGGENNIASTDKSTKAGTVGLYPIFAEAYRRAGKERGMLGRRMQSITWEQWRKEWSPRARSPWMVDTARNIQYGVERGEISREDSWKILKEFRDQLPGADGGGTNKEDGITGRAARFTPSRYDGKLDKRKTAKKTAKPAASSQHLKPNGSGGKQPYDPKTGKFGSGGSNPKLEAAREKLRQRAAKGELKGFKITEESKREGEEKAKAAANKDPRKAATREESRRLEAEARAKRTAGTTSKPTTPAQNEKKPTSTSQHGIVGFREGPESLKHSELPPNVVEGLRKSNQKLAELTAKTPVEVLANFENLKGTGWDPEQAKGFAGLHQAGRRIILNAAARAKKTEDVVYFLNHERAHALDAGNTKKPHAAYDSSRKHSYIVGNWIRYMEAAKLGKWSSTGKDPWYYATQYMDSKKTLVPLEVFAETISFYLTPHKQRVIKDTAKEFEKQGYKNYIKDIEDILRSYGLESELWKDSAVKKAMEEEPEPETEESEGGLSGDYGPGMDDFGGDGACDDPPTDNGEMQTPSPADRLRDESIDRFHRTISEGPKKIEGLKQQKAERQKRVEELRAARHQRRVQKLRDEILQKSGTKLNGSGGRQPYDDLGRYSTINVTGKVWMGERHSYAITATRYPGNEGGTRYTTHQTAPQQMTLHEGVSRGDFESHFDFAPGVISLADRFESEVERAHQNYETKVDLGELPYGVVTDRVQLNKRGMKPNSSGGQQPYDERGRYTSGTGAGGVDKDYSKQLAKVQGIFEDKDVFKSYAAKYATDKTEVDATGNWKPERRKLHRKILAEILKEYSDVPEGRKAIFTGGLGGAGKTRQLQKQAKKLGIEWDDDRNAPKNFLMVSADDMKERIHKHGGGPKVPGLTPAEASVFSHEEGSYLSKRLADIATRKGLNVIWDYTMASTDANEQRARPLIKAGYRVQAMFVDVSPGQSIKGATKRHEGGHQEYLEGTSWGGRYVPLWARPAEGSGGKNWRSGNRAAFEEWKDRPYVTGHIVIDNEGFKGDVVDDAWKDWGSW